MSSVLKEFEFVRIALEKLEPWVKETKGQNARTVIECPKCKGELTVVKAGPRDHMRGACATPGCVRWMQ